MNSWKKWWLLPLIPILFGQCTALKKERYQNTASQKLELSEKLNERVQQNRQFIFVDSGQERSLVYIWPKNEITFNPAQGFKGEAHEIAIWNEKNKDINLIAEEAKNTESTLDVHLKDQQKQEVKALEKKKQGSSNWVFLILILAAGVFVGLKGVRR